MAWKIALWIGRIVATILIACVLSIWTTSYVVSSYVQALLQQYEIPLEVEPVALADVWSMLRGNKQTEQERMVGSVNDEQVNSSDSQLDVSDVDASDGGDGSAPLVDAGAGEEQPITDDELDADDQFDDTNEEESLEIDEFTQPSQEVFAPIETDTEPTITPDQIDASMDSLDMEDKERMFELMMDKLPPESWHMFSSYIEDGLTDQELLDIEQLMAQHLSKDEYDELMALLTSY